MEGPRETSPVVVPPGLRAASEWAWRLMLIGVFGLAIGYLAIRIQAILIPVAIAILLGILLAPLRNWLVRVVRLPRGLAVAICVLGLFAGVVLLVMLAGQQIYSGFNDLRGQALAGFGQVRQWLIDGPFQLSEAQVNSYWQQAENTLTGGGALSSIASGALGAVARVWRVLIGMIITVFCTIFFLVDARRIWAFLINLLPVAARERVHQAGRRSIVTLSAYVRTQIVVGLVDAVGIAGGAALFVPRLAIPIGVLVFLGSFVPFLGAISTGVVACVVVLVSRGLAEALIMMAIVLLVQQLESHVLQPFLMGHAVSLHPVAVLLSASSGFLVAGIPGALFAVPLVAAANTFIGYLNGNDKFPQLGTADHVPIFIRRPRREDFSLAALTGSLRRVSDTDPLLAAGVVPEDGPTDPPASPPPVRSPRSGSGKKRRHQ